MTGRKTLAEVRAELEAALGAGPAGGGEVEASLRWFLAGGRPHATPGRPRPPQPHPARQDEAPEGGRE